MFAENFIMMKNSYSIAALLSLVVLMSVSCSKDGTEMTDGVGQEDAPVIRLITSEYNGKAVYDCPITIKGSNFSSEPGGNVVVFGTEKVTSLIESTNDRIVVTAPFVDGYSVKVKVISDGVESNVYSLKYDEAKCDSVLIFRNATVTELRKGVVWTSTLTSWEGQPRSLNVVSIAPSETNVLGIACPSGYVATSKQGKSAGALVAINASYFGGTKHDGYVKIGGTVKKTGVSKADGCSAYFANGAFTLNGNTPAIVSVVGNEGAAKLSEPDVLCCGPLLVNAGSVLTMASGDHNTLTHPRTAIGITEDKRVLFVTVDGRFNDAVGMSTQLLASYMEILGAEYALNLDGGGSTTMWIDGHGVVNHTCNGGWDDRTERNVGTIIYLK